MEFAGKVQDEKRLRLQGYGKNIENGGVVSLAGPFRAHILSTNLRQLTFLAQDDHSNRALRAEARFKSISAEGRGGSSAILSRRRIRKWSQNHGSTWIVTDIIQALLHESNEYKGKANDKFVAAQYGDAIEIYDKALECCPNYLFYERAVLKSNVAACYLKLEEWKNVVKVASESIDCLDSLDPQKHAKKLRNGDDKDLEENQEEIEEEVEEEEADEEIVSPGAAKAEDTSVKAKKKADIERIRSKALLRRAKARSELGGWSTLQGAEEGI
jgi:tetratricopeptide (TPR) repeat protein